MKKTIFFGCPLDGVERHEAIQEKLALMGFKHGVDDFHNTFIRIIHSMFKPHQGNFFLNGCMPFVTIQWTTEKDGLFHLKKSSLAFFNCTMFSRGERGATPHPGQRKSVPFSRALIAS